MCSVVGCGSWRRSAQRFKLPADPERRLEWVQFLGTVNKQRFKESSWTDITICSEHFKDDSFEKTTPRQSGTTVRQVQLTLKPRAVPSLCLQSEPDEPQPSPQSPKCVETVETTEVGKMCDFPTSCSEESRLTSLAAQGSPSSSLYGQMHPRNVNIDLIREKAALLQMKGKYVVNEKLLLQLFSCKCPSCGSKLQMEKVTYGVLVILNQHCLQCEYRYQWKSQVNASIPTADNHHLEGRTHITPKTQQEASTHATQSSLTAVPEIVAVIDEESDPMDETEESSDGDMDSDEDWKPVNDFLLARVLQKQTDHKILNEEEGDDDCPPLAPKHSQLCTECGIFFNKRRPHTCEHKSKPYSCNICGKRCVTEVALNSHNRVHNENYEHRCKFCHIAFKTKADKHTHEQTHITEGKPYRCPDCSETFATNKERRIHLEDHRGPRQLKCNICGIEFRSPPYLQRHLAVHTGVKPHKCSVCQRGFNQAGHLKSHMRLHTGERPYKCQHCDKCFNHNVSLKCHVQREHSSNAGHEQRKDTISNRESNTNNADKNGNTRGADSGLDNVEEEQDTDEEQQEVRPNKKRRSTGRPRGRPKSYESGNLVVAVQVEGHYSNRKTGKPQAQKSKRAQCSDEESEDELSDRDSSFDSAEEEEKSKRVTKTPARSRGRQRNRDSDSDFEPEDGKKRRYNSGKSLGKRRGRPRKTLVV